MIIAVSSKGMNKSSEFNKRFGRCDYIGLFNTETQEYSFVENDGKNQDGGAGPKAAQILIDNNVSILITGALGPNAFLATEKAGIRSFVGIGEKSIEDQVNAFKEEELMEIKQAKKGGKH